MEIELKYRIDNPVMIDKIFKDDYIMKIKDENTEEELEMRAVFFDTEEGNLGKNGFAFRVRREGDNYMATLKWGGESGNGLHKREELNVPVSEEMLTTPDIEVFSQSDIGERVVEAVNGMPLKPLMSLSYVRKQVRVDTGKSISVISTDLGSISAGGKEVPLCELEVELYSGDEDDMIALGEKISRKYNLIEENDSKFKRGLELL